MLANKDAQATVATNDLPGTAKFYQEVLGLTPLGSEGDEAAMFRSGIATVLVYRSGFAGTNRATGITWNVGDDLEAIMSELRTKGVRFEHYDLPGMTREGDVHTGGGMKVAWFKDPAGNILSLVSGPE